MKRYKKLFKEDSVFFNSDDKNAFKNNKVVFMYNNDIYKLVYDSMKYKTPYLVLNTFSDYKFLAQDREIDKNSIIIDHDSDHEYKIDKIENGGKVIRLKMIK